MQRSKQSGTIRVASTLALILVTLFASCAWADAEFELERLSSDQLRVAPGESVIYSLRIHNLGDIAGAASVFGGFYLLNRFLPAPYTLGPPSDTRCGLIHINNFGDMSFITANIAPGDSLACAWPINRPLASIIDTSLFWRTAAEHSSFSGLTMIGTLTNTSIATRTLAFSIDEQGIGHASVELSIHNGGELPIEGQGAGECYYEFDVLAEADEGEGGCGDISYSPSCFTGGGYGFALPGLQPGETHRCTFKLRSRLPYTHPLAADFRIEPEQPTDNGGMLFDTDENDNRAYAWLAPVVNADATPLSSLRWPALALLILMAGFLGLRHQHRKGR